MTDRGLPAGGPEPPSRDAEVVEVRVLLLADHLAALEAEAGRSGQTVGALIRRAVWDHLAGPVNVELVGDVSGGPANLSGSEESD